MPSPDVESFLARQRVAHLATADAAGDPHVVPVCFVLLADRIYSVLDEKPKRQPARGLRRVRNLLENPRVALVADVWDEDWSRLGFALVKGRAHLIDSGPEHAAALVALRAKYPQYRSMALEDQPIVVIQIDRTTVWGTVGER